MDQPWERNLYKSKDTDIKIKDKDITQNAGEKHLAGGVNMI